MIESNSITTQVKWKKNFCRRKEKSKISLNVERNDDIIFNLLFKLQTKGSRDTQHTFMTLNWLNYLQLVQSTVQIWAPPSTNLCHHGTSDPTRDDPSPHPSPTSHPCPMLQIPYHLHHRSHNELWLQSLHIIKSLTKVLFLTTSSSSLKQKMIENFTRCTGLFLDIEKITKEQTFLKRNKNTRYSSSRMKRRRENAINFVRLRRMLEDWLNYFVFVLSYGRLPCSVCFMYEYFRTHWISCCFWTDFIASNTLAIYIFFFNFELNFHVF